MTDHDIAARPDVVELRRYTLRPGERDSLITLFEAQFIDPQAEAGMPVLGTFRDAGEPDHFVWLRGFPSDPDARAASLQAFYYGPVWRAHSSAANATMLDSDDVLLLRTVRWDVPPALPGDEPLWVTTCVLDADPATLGVPGELDSTLAVLATAGLPNRFPQLPVRESEHAVVWLEQAAAPTPPPAALAEHAVAPPHVARLQPTARSPLR